MQKKYTTVGHQLRLLKTNCGLFSVGAILGGFVPVGVFALSGHLGGATHDLTLAFIDPATRGANCIVAALILAGCVFSAKSVYGWGSSAFVHDRWKAVGFCVLIEGTMVFSPIVWLHWLAGVFLLAINAIATGSNLIIEDNEQRQNEEPPRQPLRISAPSAPVDPSPVARHHEAEILAPVKRTNKTPQGLKELAVQMLIQKADVSEISESTGVPRATLYAWRKALRG